MNTADRIIYASMTGLFIMVVLSFFHSPSYEKGVWMGMGLFGSALSGALGFKFGVTTERSIQKETEPDVVL